MTKYPFIPKREAVYSSETPVSRYQYEWRHIPEDGIFQYQRMLLFIGSVQIKRVFGITETRKREHEIQPDHNSLMKVYKRSYN